MSGVSTALTVAGTSLLGAYIGSQGAQNAAKIQAQASAQQQANMLAAGQQASGLDLGAIGQSQSYLAPYASLGQSASTQLQNGLTDGSLTNSFNPTMSQLQNMPGYQFQLQQGLEAAQNGYAAQGLGSSGAAMKGAANYAQGLASQDVMNQANLYYTGQNNAYQRLMGVTGLGANAASNLANINQGLTTSAANAQMGAATNSASLGMAGAAASAAGTAGSANAISNGLTNAGNSYGQYNIYGQMLQNQQQLLANQAGTGSTYQGMYK